MVIMAVTRLGRGEIAMRITDYFRRFQLWRFGWHFLFALLTIISIALSIVSSLTKEEQINEIGKMVLGVAFLTGFFAILLSISEAVKSIKDSGDKMDNVADMINRNNNLLSQIMQSSRLSDAAKQLAFRDAERMELAEAVIAKLHQHEFDATAAMIDAMAKIPQYQALSVQLRRTSDTYRDATEKDRIIQSVDHILELGREFRWSQAFRQADSLVQSFPYSDEAKSVRRKLREMKDARKKELLAIWDEAVRSKDTDRSLEILKDLDQYLTPSEGLALQESAATVFRTKLHNLGVRFALAVTENKWSVAYETGQQIVRDFPNSRMAHEIRGKLDVLADRAKGLATVAAGKADE